MSVVQKVDFALIDVATDDMVAKVSEARTSGQSNIASTDDAEADC